MRAVVFSFVFIFSFAAPGQLEVEVSKYQLQFGFLPILSFSKKQESGEQRYHFSTSGFMDLFYRLSGSLWVGSGSGATLKVQESLQKYQIDFLQADSQLKVQSQNLRIDGKITNSEITVTKEMSSFLPQTFIAVLAQIDRCELVPEQNISWMNLSGEPRQAVFAVNFETACNGIVKISQGNRSVEIQIEKISETGKDLWRIKQKSWPVGLTLYKN